MVQRQGTCRTLRRCRNDKQGAFTVLLPVRYAWEAKTMPLWGYGQEKSGRESEDDEARQLLGRAMDVASSTLAAREYCVIGRTSQNERASR